MTTCTLFVTACSLPHVKISFVPTTTRVVISTFGTDMSGPKRSDVAEERTRRGTLRAVWAIVYNNGKILQYLYTFSQWYSGV